MLGRKVPERLNPRRAASAVGPRSGGSRKVVRFSRRHSPEQGRFESEDRKIHGRVLA